MILLDSDVLIDVSRGEPASVAAMDSLSIAFAEISISVVTQAELISGARDKGELAKIDHYLSRFNIVSLSDAAGRRAVALLRRYRLSHGLSLPDAFIAACAIEHSASFVTGNVKHFKPIVELKTLVEWPVSASTLRKLSK